MRVRHEGRTRGALALGLAIVSVLAVVSGMVLALLHQPERDAALIVDQVVVRIIPVLAFATLGALIGGAQRRNPIGWIFGVSGLSFGLGNFAEGYVAYALVSGQLRGLPGVDLMEDRKSTRLNSSHANISYAVFCLKKK